MTPEAEPRPDLTIIIPALNEAGNIRELVARCLGTLSRIGVAYEIIIVDGGSTGAGQQHAPKICTALMAGHRPGIQYL